MLLGILEYFTSTQPYTWHRFHDAEALAMSPSSIYRLPTSVRLHNCLFKESYSLDYMYDCGLALLIYHVLSTLSHQYVHA